MSGAVGGKGGAGAAVRQGHLRKLKTMKKKFFVLRAETSDCSARLEYYESEKKFRAGAIPRRVLPLKSCYNITRRLDLKQKHVIALFTKEEQFCVVAENEQDLHTWLSALLKHHNCDDASEELLHPIQHVWQVNVQKKGLGAEKSIHGLYNLCLTDKTLTLVKIKSHNNVISELGIPEKVEYTLKNIRRCGDSECFFYMEVGRQTATGAGELWMHSDDSNIAQSMHSTIYHAMRNCAKETEHERDHIQIPKNEPAPLTRRQSYSDGRRGREGLAAEYQPNNPLTEGAEARVIAHHRTVSLPTGCPSFQEPLRIVHERTRSAPLTGEELDTVLAKALHSSCKAVNGTDLPKKSCARRASTGMRLSKLSPAHSKNALQPLRGRSETMPSKMSSTYEIERPPPRHNDLEGIEVSRDETDTTAEWSRTPRIPEEPDVCDISKDLFRSFMFGSMSVRSGSSIQHSRTSSMGVDDAADGDGYLAMVPAHEPPSGYLPMAPAHDLLGGLVSASSGSVCSGTPSTDPRFSEYQLEPAWSHIGAETRPPRAYSVGSRPAPRPEGRHRAYSVGARARPANHPPPHHPHHPRASAEDLMLLDFSNNSPAPKATTPGLVSRTPPHGSRSVDEYVDMSPRNAGYVEMKPGDVSAAPAPPTPDGYVEMTYGRTRPIAIAAARAPPPPQASPDDRFRRKLESRTAHGSQIFEFSGSLESPLSPEASAPGEASEAGEPHHLATVREAAEEPRRSPDSTRRKEHIEPLCAEDRGVEVRGPGREPRPAVACSPQYVTLKPGAEPEEPPCKPTANKCLARIDSAENKVESSVAAPAPVVVAGAGAGAARFSVGGAGAGAPPSPSFACAPLNYAALDLEPRRAPAAPAKRTYTQIDFVRSEKLHAGAGDAT